MKDQASVGNESDSVKYQRALDLFTESVMKPDHDLRGCAHNQGCYEQLMNIREHVLEYLKSLKKPTYRLSSTVQEYTEQQYWNGEVPDDQFEKYLNKYGYEYTPTVTVDKPTRRARHSDLDAL